MIYAYIYIYIYTRWWPPVLSWFIIPLTIDIYIYTINHSCGSYVSQLNAIERGHHVLYIYIYYSNVYIHIMYIYIYTYTYIHMIYVYIYIHTYACLMVTFSNSHAKLPERFLIRMTICWWTLNPSGQISSRPHVATETHRWWLVRGIIPFYGRTIQVSELL